MRPARRVLRFLVLVAVVGWHTGCGDAPASKAGLEELEHFAGAMDHRRQVSDPERAGLYVRAAEALRANDAKTAESVYREMVERWPGDPNTHESLGACLYFQKRYEEAGEAYERALKLGGGTVDAHYGLGCIAYDQHRDREAIEHLEKALAQDPDDALCHYVLALVYEQTGDTKKRAYHQGRYEELTGP